MFVRDGSRDLELMLEKEVGVMRTMLEDAGYTVDIATATGEPMIAGSITLTPTVRLSDVDIDNYAGLALPCMAPAAGLTVPPAVGLIVADAVAQGKPIAAARGSVVTLAKAGGLDNKQYSFAAEVDPLKRPEFATGIFVDMGVTRDHNISTSGICPLSARSTGNPDGTTDLTKAFIASLDGAS